MHRTGYYAASYFWELAGRIERWRIRRLLGSMKSVCPSKAVGERLRLAFVIPWYGRDISGGAEAECWELVQGCRTYVSSLEPEVITTTLKEFASDWNQPYHSEGRHEEDGVVVHRFHPTLPDRHFFHQLNRSLLMQGGTEELKANGWKSPLGVGTEYFYLRHMIQSKTMWRFLIEHYANYDYFLYIPYMFGTSVIGGLLTADKAIIIPCLHDERYAYMRIYRELMTSVRASLYLTKSEMELASSLFGEELCHPYLLGGQANVHAPKGQGDRFRARYGIREPFLLYAGRKIEGKNLPMLIRCFRAYRQNASHSLKLVLIGKGDLVYDGDPSIVDLGFVPTGDKYDAFAAATALCQPSLLESFSIVLMESWLQKTPVLVHGACRVTREHVEESEGGMLFWDEREFAARVDWLLDNPEDARAMAERGYRYVHSHCAPISVFQRFEFILRDLAAGNRSINGQ